MASQPAPPYPGPDSHSSPSNACGEGAGTKARQKTTRVPLRQNHSVHPPVPSGDREISGLQCRGHYYCDLDGINKARETGSGGVLPRHNILSTHVPV